MPFVSAFKLFPVTEQTGGDIEVITTVAPDAAVAVRVAVLPAVTDGGGLITILSGCALMLRFAETEGAAVQPAGSAATVAVRGQTPPGFTAVTVSPLTVQFGFPAMS